MWNSVIVAFGGDVSDKRPVAIIQDQAALLVEGDVGLPIGVIRQDVQNFNPVPGDQPDGRGTLPDALEADLPLAEVYRAAVHLQIVLRFPEDFSDGDVILRAL